MATNRVKEPFIQAGRMVVLFLGLFMFAGMTGCDQAEQAMEDVTKSAEQAVDAVKDKADAVLTPDTESEDDDKESKEDEKDD